MEPGVGSIHNIDISALISLNIVALYHNLADILTIDLDTTFVCCGRNCRDEVASFFRMIRIPNVDRANSCIKPSHKRELFVENGCHALVGRMRAEASTALAEVLASLWHRIARYNHWFSLNRRIHKPYHLSRFAFLALID